MGKKSKKVTVIPRIHTRKLDRGIARKRMKEMGLVQVVKHKPGQTSWFASHWREYAY